MSEKYYDNDMLLRLELPNRIFVLFRHRDDRHLATHERKLILKVFPPLSSMDISVMTGEEVAALQHFWQEVFTIGSPVVDYLDNEAAEALAAGNARFKRLYRPAPRFTDFRQIPLPDQDEKDDLDDDSN